jgi:hypothetical protein
MRLHHRNSSIEQTEQMGKTLRGARIGNCIRLSEYMLCKMASLRWEVVGGTRSNVELYRWLTLSNSVVVLIGEEHSTRLRYDEQEEANRRWRLDVTQRGFYLMKGMGGSCCSKKGKAGSNLMGKEIAADSNLFAIFSISF